MASRVVWARSAFAELIEAAAYIARDSPRYAAALIADARSYARSLPRIPYRGRVVPELGDKSIREVFIKSYRLVYQVQDENVVILAFIHGARRFPPSSGSGLRA